MKTRSSSVRTEVLNVPVAGISAPKTSEKRNNKIALVGTGLSKPLLNGKRGIGKSKQHQDGGESKDILEIIVHNDDQDPSPTSSSVPSRGHGNSLRTVQTEEHEKQAIDQKRDTEPLRDSNERGRTRTVVPSPALVDIRAKLNLGATLETICLAKTLKKSRCKRPIAKKSIRAAETLLDRLGSLDPSVNSQILSEQLISLAELLLCRNNHQDKAEDLSNTWRDILGLATADQSVRECESLSTGTRAPVVATKSADSKIEFDTSRVYIRNFLPFDAVAKALGCTENFVREALTKKFGKREATQAGVIYIYWFPGNFGYVKIGVTGKSVEERLRGWKNKCKHIPYPVFPLSQVDQIAIPHIYRVENLIKAQLRDRRRKEVQCHGCRRPHNEWFEISKEEAIAVVRKWSAWMRENPYEQLNLNDWKLKKEQKKNLKTLCQSLPLEDQKRSVSTSQLKEREERNRRLSASPHTHRHSVSSEPLRRSARIAVQRKGSAESDVSDTGSKWALNLEPEP
ncbi:MAG: hypothetical protein Q9219_000920 [cf. Caloplaca sp. 3 TL-2023]